MVYLAYTESVGATALSLLGAKIQSSLALEGRFSTEGLAALSDSTDITTALAASLVGELQDLESAETIWRRVAALEGQPGPTATAEPPPPTATGEAHGALPIEPAPGPPAPVLPEPDPVPAASLVDPPGEPRPPVPELRGRLQRAAAPPGGDTELNSQLDFGWLLAADQPGVSAT